MTKQCARSFEAERDFGWSLSERFPGLELTEEVSDGAVLILDIRRSRGLSLRGLASTLRNASRGGIRSAVVTLKGENPTVISVDAIQNLCDLEIEVKDCIRLEGMLRACA
jgi:hypothetical protein